MEIKGCLTLPRNEDFPEMLLESMNTINKARAEEILVEKGDLEYPPGTILPEGHKKTYKSASVIEEEGDIQEGGEAKEKKGRDVKCFSCGCYFESFSWCEPPSCPHCHASRVD